MIKKEKSSQGTLSVSHGNQTPKRKINDDTDGILALVGDFGGITDTSKESNELFLYEANSCSNKSHRVTGSQVTESNSHQQIFEQKKRDLRQNLLSQQPQ